MEILKDAGTQVYRLFPLFLPFTLVLYLPTSMLVSFQSTDEYLQRNEESRQIPVILNFGKRINSTASQVDHHPDPGRHAYQVILFRVLFFPLFRTNCVENFIVDHSNMTQV